VGFWLGYAKVSIGKYQTSMPKLTQWAEGNIPEGLSVFGLGLCEFNRKRLKQYYCPNPKIEPPNQIFFIQSSFLN
jgi:hypothetical protein